jgi:hypothetical protein
MTDPLNPSDLPIDHDDQPASDKAENPALPESIADFDRERISQPEKAMPFDSWRAKLRGTEIDDMRQKIKLRPWIATAIYILLCAQNLGIWYIIKQALDTHQLVDLQLIFSALIGGTLIQSYLILRLITEKIYGDIDYHNDTKGHKKP